MEPQLRWVQAQPQGSWSSQEGPHPSLHMRALL